MKQNVLLIALLVLIWVALSGHYSTEPLIAFFAVVSVLVVWLLARRMSRQDGVPSYPITSFGVLGRHLAYLPYLAKEVVGANLTVARFVIGSRDGWQPRVLRVRATQKTPLGRAVYANSITLTPGTVTLDVSGDEMLVHALGPESAAAVVSGEMDRRVSRLEGEG
jgi:multicomponent Na+:H+ antiporter subunit E